MFEREYFGFYWTLPVPWAGFRTLPRDVDAAAQASRTVRYQRDRVRRWVKDEGGTLIGEEAFIELEPDRGTAEITPEIERTILKCRRQHAAIILVDFSIVFGWRRHQPLWSTVSLDDVEIHPLTPDPLILDDGHEFDPLQHFRAWRRRQEAWSSSKNARKQELTDLIEGMHKAKLTFTAIASMLNMHGHLTLSGKSWTSENVRKFLKGV